MSKNSEITRREFKASDDIRDAGLTTPDDITRYDDIPYGSQSHWQALDVYRPRAAEGNTLPVIVSVHGGGWVYGSKETYQHYCMSLAQRGFAVVNFSYRLAPEYRYPASMEDSNAVFRWVIDHAGEYGLDAGHVFAVGDSAGGHMLALYACICTNPDYAARYAFAPPAGFAPTALGLNCGVYDMSMRAEAGFDRHMADLLPGGGTPEEFELINPLDHMTPRFPPTFFMTSNDDSLRPQAPVLAARLTELDVPFVYRHYGDWKTRLGHDFHCDVRSPQGRACNDEECDFFRRFL